MDNYRQSIEKANRAFGQVEVAEISLLKTKGPVEVMTLNAAGLVEALRLGAVHCYKSFSRREAQELLRQVSQLPSWEGVTAKEVLVMVGQFIEGNFLTPKLVGDNVGLHPVWVMFALLAGGVLLGFLGLMIAVPVAAIIGVLIRYAIEQYKESSLYLE